ncbi:MAG: acylneuraminate cytidylyltransferase family protein [Candidatus Marinimicrobia bacterium]|jgi:N-acylneuraminate cytidylyltransferase|nr:acylneuraminate cytidylyltransferase family protein [Candidatus Neomarinimicrobiota bacterium]MBT3577127.1 acylneuraminate cytidylyltransferase family protein [Candidatus Neomarinimicrobiota bacterium]MBT3680009.1 acylneuraminate cytidylyltransferase family protein [Candidatus Neomarinimicrobiota bacterium]MBT3949596.1 acylneuraminate cytidylyltransferase family protein [Candidatus Neomarinimicrobiota bacterium]MBT4253253.1 acylneuraminate cytidylyltransferase family protein [Candidatus Neom
MSIFCIIPARGGSKGVPHKNIAPFLGQPLISHSIKYALESMRVDRVFVSTDDEQIANISRSDGAEVIPRPADIAGDTATTESAISHAIEWWQAQNLNPTTIILLQATSPLRPKGSLDKALEIFQSEGFDSLLSISPTHRFFWKVEGLEARAEYDFMNRPRRQDMTEADIRYVENGSVYVFSLDHFNRTGNRLGGKIGYTIFPEEFSPEIDIPSDFNLLEEIAENLER